MILTQEQAQCVFDLIIEAGRIGALLHIRILNPNETTTHVQEYLTDEVNVWVGDAIGNPHGPMERYKHFSEFGKAYGVGLPV